MRELCGERPILVRMLLAEDLVVLLVATSSGDLPRHSGTQSALAAALLVELAESRRVTIVDDDVVRTDTTTTDDPILDAALAALAERQPVTDAVAAIVPDLYVRLLDRLVERGILAPKARNLVPLAPRHIWRVADTTRRDHLRVWLAGVLSGHSAADQWSAALISLLHALNLVDVVTDGTAAFERAEEISRSGWAAAAVIHPIIDRGHLLADFSAVPGPQF